MCMKLLFCQSERLPEILMISEIHTIGGTSKYMRWE